MRTYINPAICQAAMNAHIASVFLVERMHQIEERMRAAQDASDRNQQPAPQWVCDCRQLLGEIERLYMSALWEDGR